MFEESHPLIKECFIAFVGISVILDLFYRFVWAPKAVRDKREYELFVYRYVTSYRIIAEVRNINNTNTALSRAVLLSALECTERISTLRRVNIYRPHSKRECTEKVNASTNSARWWLRIKVGILYVVCTYPDTVRSQTWCIIWLL